MFDFKISKLNSSKLNKKVKENKDKLNVQTNLNAVYVGVVEDTNDPRGLGRVKVRIPSLHGTSPNQSFFMPTKQIPWATPGNLAGGSNDMGQYIVPTKGSQVNVTFELNSFSKPIYLGTVPSNTNGNMKYYNDNDLVYGGKSVDVKSNDRISDLSNRSSDSVRAQRNKSLREKMTSGKTVIYKSLKGATIMMDDEDGYENITFMDASGQMLQLGNNSGKTLPRRRDKTRPSSKASTYMALKNGQGDSVTITKGKIINKISSGDVISLDEDDISIETSGGDIISLNDGKISVSTSGGDVLSLEDGSINMETSGGDSMSLEDGNINMKTSNGEEVSLSDGKASLSTLDGSMSLDGTTATISNGTGSISLNGSSTTISNGSGSLSLSGTDVYINGAKVWNDNYHPGV